MRRNMQRRWDIQPVWSRPQGARKQLFRVERQHRILVGRHLSQGARAPEPRRVVAQDLRRNGRRDDAGDGNVTDALVQAGVGHCAGISPPDKTCHGHP